MDTGEFLKERKEMVSFQLERRGIRDSRVLEAMLRVPRHEFVPPAYRHRAYDDCALPTEDGQTISQPYMVAIMTEQLSLTGAEKVLEVGTGSGYQSAILSLLAHSVFTIERSEGLAGSARDRLSSLGYDNIQVTHGDGTLGWPSEAPFDRIIVTAGAPSVPEPLIEQLAEGGIMVIPVGSEYSQELLRIEKKGGGTTEKWSIPCVFVPLVGEHAWKRDSRNR